MTSQGRCQLCPLTVSPRVPDVPQQRQVWRRGLDVGEFAAKLQVQVAEQLNLQGRSPLSAHLGVSCVPTRPLSLRCVFCPTHTHTQSAQKFSKIPWPSKPHGKVLGVHHEYKRGHQRTASFAGRISDEQRRGAPPPPPRARRPLRGYAGCCTRLHYPGTPPATRDPVPPTRLLLRFFAYSRTFFLRASRRLVHKPSDRVGFALRARFDFPTRPVIKKKKRKLFSSLSFSENPGRA